VRVLFVCELCRLTELLTMGKVSVDSEVRGFGCCDWRALVYSDWSSPGVRKQNYRLKLNTDSTEGNIQ